MVRAYAKPVELAQFNLASCTANGAFATSRMRHSLGEIPVPPLNQPQFQNAKKRRLSRPNTVEEIRRKRRIKRNKQEYKKKAKVRLSRQEKRQKATQKFDKIQEIVGKQERKTKSLSGLADRERRRAMDYWRKWDKEKELRAKSNL